MSDDPLTFVLTREFVPELARVLGLPEKNMRAFSLITEGGEAVRIEVEYFFTAAQAGELKTVIETYRLVKVQGEA